METFFVCLHIFGMYIVELIVACLFLIRHPKRFRFKPYIGIPLGLIISFGVLTILSLLLNYLYPKYLPWNEIVNILFYTALMVGVYFSIYVVFKIDALSLVLLVSIAATFQHIAYQMGIIALDTGLGTALRNDLDAWAANLIYSTILLLIKVGIYVLCYFFLAKPLKKCAKYRFNLWSIVALTVADYIMINVVNVFVSQHFWMDTWGRAVICISLIVFSIIYDVLIISIFRIYGRTEEKAIIEMTLSSKVRQFELQENNINFINIKFHDLRKELRRLKEHKESLTDEDFVLLEKSLRLFDNEIDSGNDNIDALIQDKLIYCKSVGIDFTPLVDAEALEAMDASDVYFLLMNILDNAIEAVENCEKEEERVITLMINKKQGTTVIEQTNYFNGELIFNRDGSIRTTKKDVRHHGFGTKSINFIVKKYNGTIHYDSDKNIFSLKIVI